MNHDSFFKITFQDKENAIDFLKTRLPPELLKDVALESLEIVKDSFIDPNFQDIHSDMLFKVLIAGKPSYVYLLLEHKSYMDQLTSFQLLKYMVGIWSLHLSQLKKGEPVILPLILPMVLYHGKEEWKYGTDFLSFQESMEGWTKYQINFSYIIYDFSTYKDEEIKGEIVTRLFTLLFKYINRDDFEEKLYPIVSLLAELMEKTTAMEYVEAVLLYLLSGVRKIELDRIEKMLDTVKNGRSKKMLATLAERLEERGYKRGLEESKAMVEQSEQKGYAKAMELVEIERQRAKQERQRAKQERQRAERAERKAEAEKRKAERRLNLRTAITMKKKGFTIDQITSITELETKFLEKLFKKLNAFQRTR